MLDPTVSPTARKSTAVSCFHLWRPSQRAAPSPADRRKLFAPHIRTRWFANARTREHIDLEAARAAAPESCAEKGIPPSVHTATIARPYSQQPIRNGPCMEQFAQRHATSLCKTSLLLTNVCRTSFSLVSCHLQCRKDPSDVVSQRLTFAPCPLRGVLAVRRTWPRATVREPVTSHPVRL